MQEVSGPVVGIALILAAVFIPVGLMSGIQGRLNQQFAITIAVSVLISAFNALTLSPALSAMLLRPRKRTRGPARPVLRRVQSRARAGDARLRQPEPRPDPQAARSASACCCSSPVATALLGQRLPTSFLPEEDYGYFLLNVQLPPAASLERTDAVARKIDDDPARRPRASTNFNTIVGFSLLTRVTASNNAFYFVQLKPWDERTTPTLQARAIVNRLNGEFAARSPRRWRSPSCRRRFPVSAARAASRCGCRIAAAARSSSSNEQSADVPRRRAEAARARRRRRRRSPPAVPQLYADVDRDKVAAAGRRARRRLSDDAGVSRRAVREPVQPVRPAVARVPAGRGRRPAHARADRPVLRPQQRGHDGAALGGADDDARRSGRSSRTGSTCIAPRRSRARAAPGYSSGQAMAALEEVARADAAARDRLRLVRPVVPGAAGVGHDR